MSKQKGNPKPPVGVKLHNIRCAATTPTGRCRNPATVLAVAAWCDEHKPKGT